MNNRQPIEAGVIEFEYNGFKGNNMIMDSIKSKRIRTVVEECDALNRKMKQRERLRKKLEIKKLEIKIRDDKAKHTKK